ncbi:MAG: tRNA pseudouridine(55) synthase TruB [Treponema sp.]|jgi:tRNA pseudouridine55 synthase|nr:tRNA pseudouridine(55) synthase TruB [Treponema sp.]
MREIEKNGLLLLRKKGGQTSFESLYPVKKALGTGKVGHTGTLDKFAEGLLLVLIGRAVKLTPWFSGCEKTYEGIIRFGLETDTLDPEGLPVAEAAPPSREAVEAALPAFRGEILQTPPAYSAVHLGGERASRLARSGTEPVLPQRPVLIYELNLLSYEVPLARIRVRCSKGTYIRALARDIALAAHSRAYLISLNRSRVGGFALSRAFELSPEDEPSRRSLINALRPIDETVFEALGLPYLFIEDRDLPNMIRGKKPETFIDEAKLRFPRNRDGCPPVFTGGGAGEDFAAGVFFSGGFAGIMEKKAGKWAYGYVYARD